MRYVGNVIRPPSEAESLIVQVTTGCSHNRCRFCGAYPQRFTVKPLPAVAEDLDWFVDRAGDRVQRLFLADGNALVRTTDDLLAIASMARERFPRLRRVATYANAADVARKRDDELQALHAAGFELAYLGLESGDDEVLRAQAKGATAAEMITAVQRLQAAGIKASVIGLLGLAGADEAASRRHADLTARAVNAMQPRYVSFLTVMVVPGTPLAADEAEGRFILPEPPAVLGELRRIIEGLRLDRTVFRSNHASNYLPLAGILSRDQERLLHEIDRALDGAVPLTPEFWRGL